MEPRVRPHRYAIIRLLTGTFYALGILVLLLGISAGVYLLARAASPQAAAELGGPVVSPLDNYAPGQLRLMAGGAVLLGFLGFLILGAVGQFLSMQRDRAISGALQVQLLEDILELNEEITTAASGTRVEMCEGCGRLGSLHRIDSGQWMCRDCRRQLRSA